MKLNKVTVGFVIQTYDTKLKRFVAQEFIAGDQVNYENRFGEDVDCNLFRSGRGKARKEAYLPFDMVQPRPWDGPDCAVCGEQAITERQISINNAPKKSLPVCEIHADAADEDQKVQKRA